jgi:hypothetical protein
MNKTENESGPKGGGDVVLEEIRRIKEELFAAQGHDIHRLFAEAREREEHSGHQVANFEKEKTAKGPRND